MKTRQANFRILLRAMAPMIAGLALSLQTASSFAAVTAEQRIACTPDVFRLCSSEIPDVGRITSCLVTQKSNLSHACRTVIDTALAKKTASSN